jgi:hypothetical protein
MCVLFKTLRGEREREIEKERETRRENREKREAEMVRK